MGHKAPCNGEGSRHQSGPPLEGALTHLFSHQAAINTGERKYLKIPLHPVTCIQKLSTISRSWDNKIAALPVCGEWCFQEAPGHLFSTNLGLGTDLGPRFWAATRVFCERGCKASDAFSMAPRQWYSFFSSASLSLGKEHHIRYSVILGFYFVNKLIWVCRIGCNSMNSIKPLFWYLTHVVSKSASLNASFYGFLKFFNVLAINFLIKNLCIIICILHYKLKTKNYF